MRNGANMDRGGVGDKIWRFVRRELKNNDDNKSVLVAERQISQISFGYGDSLLLLFFFFSLQSVLSTESKCSEDVFQHKSHKYKRHFESNFNHTGPSKKWKKWPQIIPKKPKGRNVVKLPILSRHFRKDWANQKV